MPDAGRLGDRRNSGTKLFGTKIEVIPGSINGQPEGPKSIVKAVIKAPLLTCRSCDILLDTVLLYFASLGTLFWKDTLSSSSSLHSSMMLGFRPVRSFRGAS